MRPNQTTFARFLRQQHNPAEAALWVVLKNRQLGGHKFVRQYPVGPYIADFACRMKMLVVEVDGSQHVGSRYDLHRDGFMARLGYSVVRFPSVSVLKNRAAVCDTILAILEGRIVDSVSTLDLAFTPSLTCHPPGGVLSRKRAR